MSSVFPVLCYSSVLYLPFIVVKRFCDIQIGSDFYDFVYSILSGFTIKPSLVNYFRLSLYLLIHLLLVLWWLYLVYIGLKSLFPQNTRLGLIKAVTFSYMLFLAVQTVSSFTILGFEQGVVLRNQWTLATDEIGRELAKTPPRYLQAASLSERLYEDETLPEYGRYAFKLKKIAYILANPFYKQDSRFISGALHYSEIKQYRDLETLLNKYLRTAVLNDRDILRPLYVSLIQDLDDAIKLRTSPTFVNLQGKSVNLYYTWVVPDSFVALYP